MEQQENPVSVTPGLSAPIVSAVDSIVTYKPSYRTAAGWVCVIGLAHVFFMNDLINFAVQSYAAHKMFALPLLQRPDATVTMELIVLFCTLAGIKTFDRMKGVATQ